MPEVSLATGKALPLRLSPIRAELFKQQPRVPDRPARGNPPKIVCRRKSWGWTIEICERRQHFFGGLGDAAGPP